MNSNKTNQPTNGILPDKYVEVRGNDKDERFEYKPFKFIPNVKRFKVLVKDMDELFAKFGINRRLTSADFRIENYTNAHLNRYMVHQLKRMKYANNKLYWVIAKHILKRSNIFLVSGINHVYPKWSREMDLSNVIRLASGVKRIAKATERRIDMSRLYIPKDNGKWRPLGIPTPAWRIYLHMLNNMIVYFMATRNLFDEEQHGFVPNRGTTTAWERILKEVITSRDIYEFDLEKFFDKVNIEYIRKVMLEKGFPKDIADKMYFLNTSSVLTKAPYKLNEFGQKLKALMTKGKYASVVNAPQPIGYMYRIQGVPQGAPTSPILATLALTRSILHRGMKTIMYADDGLYYGNIDQPVITPNSGMIEANIYFNLQKTNWVKRDGVWLKPLKFLGIEFDGKTLKGKTRKGSELVYDKEALIHAFYERANNKQLKTRDTWIDLIRTKLLGFVQSRLYSGSWNNEDIEQCFELTRKKNSYVDKMSKQHLTIYNYSSLASKWLAYKLRKNLKNY